MNQRDNADEALSSLKTQLTVENNIQNIADIKSAHEARAVALMDEVSLEMLTDVFRLGVEAGVKLMSEKSDL